MQNLKDNKVHNGVLLRPYRCYGNSQVELPANLHAMKNNELAYISGRHIVIYDAKSQKQRFVVKDNEDTEVIGFECSNKNQSALFALAYETVKGKVPVCGIYLSSNKLVSRLEHSHLSHAYNISFMCFSHCETYLITFAYSKECQKGVFTCWAVLLGSVNATEECTVAVDYIVSSPWHSKGVLYVAGTQIIELVYKRKENRFMEKPIPHGEVSKYLATSDDSLRGIEHNRRMNFIFYVFGKAVLFYSKNLFVERITVSRQSDQLSPGTITAVCSFNNTLLVTLEKDPLIYIYTLQKDLVFAYSDSIDTGEDGYNFIRILNFSLAYDTSLIALSVLRSKGSTAETESTATVELGYILPTMLEAVNYSPKESFILLNHRAASGKPIIDVSLAENLDIMACLAEDRSIKLIETAKTGKDPLSAMLIRQGLAMDMHPGGRQCAIGFKEGLKIYFVLEGELKEVFESYSKLCYCVKYSAKGDRLAVSSANSIIIYDAYTFEMMQNISAYASNIKNLFWRGRDAYLISNCVNNTVYVWNTRKWEKDFEYFMPDKNSSITSLDYDPELDLLLYSTTESMMYMVYDKGTLEVMSYKLRPTVISYLLIDKSHKVLYAGTTDGCVLIYLWPLVMTRQHVECFRIPLHASAVRKITVTCSERELVTASDDCSIYFNRILYYDESLRVNTEEIKDTLQATETHSHSFDDEGKDGLNFLDLIDINKRNEVADRTSKFQLKIQDFSFVSGESMRRLKSKIKDLDFNIQNIKNEIEDQQDVVVKQQKIERGRNEEDKRSLMEKERRELEVLEDAYNNKHDELEAEETALKAELTRRIAELNTYREETLIALYKENDDINKEFMSRCEEIDQQSMQVDEKYSVKITETEAEFADRIQKIRDDYRVALDNLKLDQMKFNETLSQMEQEYRKELLSKQQVLQGRIIDEKKHAEDLKSMNLKLVKEAKKNREKALYLENIIQEAENQNKQLLEEIRALKERADVINNELAQQEVNINKKEILLKEFRTKNNYLQSNKEIYDHLVDSLKEEYTRLSEYMNGINSNLKITHKRLIEEAESNKVLARRKERVLEELKTANDRLLATRLGYRNVVRNIESFVFELKHVVDDYSLGEAAIDKAVQQLLQRTELIFQGKKKEGEKGDQTYQPEHVHGSRSDPKETKDAGADDVNETNEARGNGDNFKDELDRLKDVYVAKLKETKSKFTGINHQRANVLDSINDEGKSLINRCTALKSKRMQLYQNLYDNKNKADTMAKELNAAKLKKYKEKVRKSQLVEDHAPKSPKKPIELPYHLYLEQKGRTKNENKAGTDNLTADVILKEAVTYCKKSRKGKPNGKQ